MAGQTLAAVSSPALVAVESEVRVDGQTSLLVGHRSGAERRWIERGQAQSASGYYVRRRYSDCGVDSCRSFCLDGQPAMRFIQQLESWSVPAQGVVISCVSRCPRSWVDCPAWGSGS